MKQKQRNEGITLTTLAITITILIILAGVTIGVFTGHSEVIDNASNAKIMTELSQLKDKLYQIKTKEGNSLIKEGNYSGEISNHDLALNSIITEFQVNIDEDGDGVYEVENAIVGIVDVEKVYDSESNKSLLGKNKYEIGESSLLKDLVSNSSAYSEKVQNIQVGTDKSDLRTDFTDVFAINVDDSTLYYVRDSQIWKLPGNSLSSGGYNIDND